jgi:hypothetical protein
MNRKKNGRNSATSKVDDADLALDLDEFLTELAKSEVDTSGLTLDSLLKDIPYDGLADLLYDLGVEEDDIEALDWDTATVRQALTALL